MNRNGYVNGGPADGKTYFLDGECLKWMYPPDECVSINSIKAQNVKVKIHTYRKKILASPNGDRWYEWE